MWDSLSSLLTLLESFDKNNPEMGMDSVAKQMHQKTVQHYWVNIVKQQVMRRGCPTLKDTLIHEQIELQAKLLNYFLGSNKSNINQSSQWRRL